MKTRVNILFALLLFPVLLFGQRQGRNFEDYYEKYKAERVSYITKELDLTVDEAEKFWPVYNEHQQKRDSLLRMARPGRSQLSREEIDVKKMEVMMDQKIENDLKLAKLAAEYHKKFKKILPIEKVYKMYRAEQDFMHQMVRRVRESEKGRNR